MSGKESTWSAGDTRLSAVAWFATIAGLCSSFIGIGLARFAYTPLIPPLIEAHWFSSADVVRLSAANYVGYLVGALSGRAMAAALSNRWALRCLTLATALSFIACAYPLSVPWFFAWRFVAGVGGGGTMVLVAATILPHVPSARRGFAGGLIFLGVGLGIAASGTFIPALLRLGLRATWIGLGLVSLLATAVSWFGWPASNPSAPVEHARLPDTISSARGLLVLYAQYALNALGIVPPMMLLVDYIARGLGRGAEVGALVWVLYGLAAIGGPIVCGQIGDHIGFRLTYRGALLMQALSLVILALLPHLAWTFLSAILLGAFTPGIVPLVLGRLHELLPGDHGGQRAAWSRATAAFALFQVLGGYGYAYLFTANHDDYALVFLVGAAALALAFVADFFSGSARAR